ncbi:MAG: phosphate ABC transporter ATP-binding protein [Candidatus Promineifilaceae bacterium]
MSETDLYRMTDLTKTYENRTVLNVPELVVERGEILGLVGPSGAGKSTLLRILGFLEEPSRGQLYFHDRLCDGEWPQIAQRRKVTMLFQSPLLLRRTVFDNVEFGLKLRGNKQGGDRVHNMIRQLGLSELSAAQARTLSGGEAQRVALARSLVIKPEVLLLDEPTSNLDPYNINLIEEMIRRVNREAQMTIVVVTHNIFQAKRLADRVGLLMDSKLVEVNETAEFFNNPQRAETAAFVKGEIVY